MEHTGNKTENTKATALITAVHRERYEILVEQKTSDTKLNARLKTGVYYQDKGGEAFPTVGDRVRIQTNRCGDALILETLPRTSVFYRENPTPGMECQAVAANFDYVFLVMSMNHDFNQNRLDRYLTAAWESGATPVVILTKKDLCEEPEYYVNLVHAMDEFAGDLVRAVEERNEPTVLVFYGDHLPTMNLEAKDLKSRYLYNTNYVIWDNIGLEKKDGNVAAYQVMADVFERLDIHAGTVFNYHQQRRHTKNYLADLELLQYDIMYGDQYVYAEEGSPMKEGHMYMGVKDAVISQVTEQYNKTYSIYGENFTKQSKVFINGEKQKTTFLNNTRLDLKESKLSDGDTIMVAQVGSSNTTFRTTKTYKYNAGTLTEMPPEKDAPENGRQAFVVEKEEKEK